MTSLRSRVLTVAAVGLAVTVGLLTAAAAWLAYDRSLQVLDEDLQRQLVHILSEASTRPIDEVLAVEAPAARVSTLLVDDTGRILARSRGPEDVDTAIDLADLQAVQGAQPTQVAAGDTTLRAIAQPISPTYRVVVAGEYDAVRAQAWRAAGLVAVIGGTCLLLGLLGTSLALSREVRPVRQLAQDTATVLPEDLTPVAVPNRPRELADLATEINELLTRVRDEDGRRRQFLATLSHEMRTPLAVARGHLEALALYGSRDEQDARQTAAAAVAEIGRAAAMLDAFLTLARAQEPGQIAPVPEFLPDLVTDLRLRLSAFPQVVVGEVSAATVPLDRERIGQAVLNCVANALRDAATVRVDLKHTPAWLLILIDDDGPGWPADRDRLLEPFVSGADSTGLGLAVVAAVAAAHGGDVALLDSPLGGARVRIRVPSTTA